MFFVIWLFAPKIPKSRQDAFQNAFRNGLKLAVLRSKIAILGPSWRQVGQLSAILALTWPILAPRCALTDLQVEPQTRPKSHLGPSWRQEGCRAPNHPWSSNFQGFDLIFEPIFEHIFIILLQFFPNFQPQVRQGGGFARAAHWIIRRPPEGCRACVNLGVQLVQYQITKPT